MKKVFLSLVSVTALVTSLSASEQTHTSTFDRLCTMEKVQNLAANRKEALKEYLTDVDAIFSEFKEAGNRHPEGFEVLKEICKADDFVMVVQPIARDTKGSVVDADEEESVALDDEDYEEAA
jgi:hypothetical protein